MDIDESIKAKIEENAKKCGLSMTYYRFVGYIEISGGDRKQSHTAETRKGVAVQYLTA